MGPPISEDKTKRARTAILWLSGCAGCEAAILSLGRSLIQLYQGLLMDAFFLVEDRLPFSSHDTHYDYLLFTGAVATEGQLALVEEGRRRSKRIIALGTCATHGGIPAMANRLGLGEVSKEINPSIKRSGSVLPKFLPDVLALDEVVTVDLLVPGCPPSPKELKGLLKAMGHMGPRPTGGKSVCDHCPMERQGRFETKILRRLLPGSYPPSTTLGNRCLLEEGFLCLGPVTLAGCGADGPPLCLKAHVPCRGCYGPVPGCHNQLLGMATILSTHGVSLEGLLDPGGLNRFIGAHGIYTR